MIISLINDKYTLVSKLICYDKRMESTSTSAVINAENLVKDFGNNRGIFDVSFSVQPGEIVGFVGPNGAGKSTTINILTGLTNADSGNTSLFGQTIYPTNVHKVLRRVGVMYSESTLDETKTARQIFQQTQQLFIKDCSASWQSMSKQFNLDIDKKVKKLSLGNKKKVAAVRALMHEPELIIMDEPTSGFDPIIKDVFLGLLRGAADRGAAVFLSSHDLTEVQHISSRILMIKNGKVILDDATPKILNSSLRLFRLISPPKQLTQKLSKLSGIHDFQTQGSDVLLQTSDYEKILKIMGATDFYNYFVEQPSLEDTFKEKYE